MFVMKIVSGFRRLHGIIQLFKDHYCKLPCIKTNISRIFKSSRFLVIIEIVVLVHRLLSKY